MNPKRTTAFCALALLVCAPLAQGQVTYCRDIGGNKTYCTGGTVIHHHGRSTVITNVAPQQHLPSAALQPNPLLQNNALPTLDVPYTAAGTQQQALPAMPAPVVVQPARPDAPGAPVILVPSTGNRICHQFGTTLVCN